MTTIFITGTAGFIGYHLAELLLGKGYRVVGYDGMTDYYDVSLKRRRHAMLSRHPFFQRHLAMLENRDTLQTAIDQAEPDAIVHLAAQAGVRYSLENPQAYIDANITGTFNLLESVRQTGTKHLLMASTSSVYGSNAKKPFCETDRVESPMTLYAATKRANEAMAHSYAHLFDIPTTMLRFFTVYGPWGRPDLALFKFVRAALAGDSIEVFNHGQMTRDFTYVADLVKAIELLVDAVPIRPGDARTSAIPGDTLSNSAPYRTVNIGNGQEVPLLTFIDEIEAALGMPIARKYLPMQQGDVPGTLSDTTLLHGLTGYRPGTSVRDGIGAFVDWYLDYYHHRSMPMKRSA